MRDQLGEGRPRFPSQHRTGFRGVADEEVDLGRPEELLVLHDVLALVETDVAEGHLAELADRMRLAGGDDVVATARPAAACSHIAST